MITQVIFQAPFYYYSAILLLLHFVLAWIEYILYLEYNRKHQMILCNIFYATANIPILM